jgi:hypothetical protein
MHYARVRHRVEDSRENKVKRFGSLRDIPDTDARPGHECRTGKHTTLRFRSYMTKYRQHDADSAEGSLDELTPRLIPAPIL